MVTGKAVDVEPTTSRFSLPAEHAAFLTRTAAADNMAVFAQHVAIMGGVEDDIVECFRKGGGVPYSRFTRVLLRNRPKRVRSGERMTFTPTDNPTLRTHPQYNPATGSAPAPRRTPKP